MTTIFLRRLVTCLLVVPFSMAVLYTKSLKVYNRLLVFFWAKLLQMYRPAQRFAFFRFLQILINQFGYLLTTLYYVCNYVMHFCARYEKKTLALIEQRRSTVSLCTRNE